MLLRYISKAIGKFRYLIRFVTVKPSDLDDRPKIFQGANRRYQKFIILGHQRSGSSMVNRALKKHPQIAGFGELFIPPQIGFFIEGYDNNSVKLLALRNKYPIEFIERYVFPSYRDDIRAVGFRLFPDQVDNERLRCVWQWVKEHKDLKIIHLERRNLLATYTSLLIAKTDGYFAIEDKAKRSKTTIAIDPKACLETFRKRKQYSQEIKKCIENHEVLELSYEKMTVDPQGYLKNIQEFLGVDVCDLGIDTVKQEVRPLPTVIQNYDELRQRFLGTEWEYLFDLQ